MVITVSGEVMTPARPDNDPAVFGPVPSRRLGLSLGVDLLTPKTCTLNCVYCELGATGEPVLERKAYRDAQEVLRQVRARLGEMERQPDYITLAGSGEPTLHRDLGLVLGELRKMTPARLAVLTNATLINDPEVRADLALADVVAPSLDAVSPRAFRRVNRPGPGIGPQKIIEGLVEFSKEFAGEIWLEILLVDGVNDDDDEIDLLIDAARRIKPDLVQLNTVVRPPAAAGFSPVSAQRLEEIAARFPMPCKVIASPQGSAGADRGSIADQVVEMTWRRPCTLEDIAAMTGQDRDRALRLIDELIECSRLEAEPFADKTFYRGVK